MMPQSIDKTMLKLALVLGALLALPQSAAAALTCKQVFAIAQAAVQYRDEGRSLKQVMAALKDVEEQQKLNATEMNVLRNAVSMAFLSNATPEEIALECVNSGAFESPKDGPPAPK